jgi:hypothetical protein
VVRLEGLKGLSGATADRILIGLLIAELFFDFKRVVNGGAKSSPQFLGRKVFHTNLDTLVSIGDYDGAGIPALSRYGPCEVMKFSFHKLLKPR